MTEEYPVDTTGTAGAVLLEQQRRFREETVPWMQAHPQPQSPRGALQAFVGRGTSIEAAANEASRRATSFLAGRSVVHLFVDILQENGGNDWLFVISIVVD